MVSKYLLIGSCVAATAAAYTTGVAKFSGNGPTGTVTFIQEAAGKPTKIEVDLQNIQGHNSWFVNAFPVMEDCSVMSIGPSFDPTGSTAALPCAKGAACRVGDLEGKHGWLNGSHAKLVVMDEAISLVGVDSIMYRSVLLGSQNGSRYACATIKDKSPLTVLKAEFRAPQPVIGNIYFMQDKDKADAETTVLMDLVFANGSALHNATYHVHEESLSTNHSCDAAGKHYNPTSGAACGKEAGNWTKCEVGDLSGRHGVLSLPVTQDGKRMFSDPLLSLSGPHSIEKRSIVIHGDKNKRLVCAPIVATQAPFKDAFEHHPFHVRTPANRNLRQA